MDPRSEFVSVWENRSDEGGGCQARGLWRVESCELGSRHAKGETDDLVARIAHPSEDRPMIGRQIPDALAGRAG